MNEKLKTPLNSKILVNYDEYCHANEFYCKGFRKVNDFMNIRLFEYLNIARNDNNKAEEMLLCLYHYLHGSYDCEHSAFWDDPICGLRQWVGLNKAPKDVTLGELLLDNSISSGSLLILFDFLSAAFYKSDEYDSRHYKYASLGEIRAARRSA